MVWRRSHWPGTASQSLLRRSHAPAQRPRGICRWRPAAPISAGNSIRGYRSVKVRNKRFLTAIFCPVPFRVTLAYCKHTQDTALHKMYDSIVPVGAPCTSSGTPLGTGAVPVLRSDTQLFDGSRPAIHLQARHGFSAPPTLSYCRLSVLRPVVATRERN